MNVPSAIGLVIFDMDGVVFEGRNFWLDLHRAMGTEPDAWRLWKAFGRSDYAHLCTVTVNDLWRGQGAEPFFELIAARRYVDGIFDVFNWLQARKIRTAIVSTGPYQLAERAMRDLKIDRILANRVGIKDGRFAGTVDVMVDENRKDDAAREIMAALHVAPAHTAMIGDSLSDVRMAAVVGLSIAYDPEGPELTAAASTVLSAGSLRRAIDIFEAVMNRGNPGPRNEKLVE